MALLFRGLAMLDDVRQRVGEIRLTARQADCIALVARGLSSKEIARELGISPSTVDNHIAIAMNQHGFVNRNAVARWYRESIESNPVETGLITQQQTTKLYGPSNSDFTNLQLGGIRNSLSLKERLFAIAQVAILSIMAVSAVTTFVLGLIFLLRLRI
jgi:DNA-binding CsgD family transcriptional regulator